LISFGVCTLCQDGTWHRGIRLAFLSVVPGIRRLPGTKARLTACSGGGGLFLSSLMTARLLGRTDRTYVS
jgi:hypothetical protein